MAIGPLARVFVQAAVMGISIIARALPAAYGAALQNARKSGMDAAKAKAESSGGLFSSERMAVDEALMVLNLTDMKSSSGEIDPVLVQKVRFICKKKTTQDILLFIIVKFKKVFLYVISRIKTDITFFIMSK